MRTLQRTVSTKCTQIQNVFVFIYMGEISPHLGFKHRLVGGQAAALTLAVAKAWHQGQSWNNSCCLPSCHLSHCMCPPACLPAPYSLCPAASPTARSSIAGPTAAWDTEHMVASAPTWLSSSGGGSGSNSGLGSRAMLEPGQGLGPGLEGKR